MSKIKNREPKGLTKRRQLVDISNIGDAQKSNRAIALSLVDEGNIARWTEVLLKGVEKGEPWAMNMFAQQFMGPIEQKTQTEIVDVAAILKEFRKSQGEEKVVDGEVISQGED